MLIGDWSLLLTVLSSPDWSPKAWMTNTLVDPDHQRDYSYSYHVFSPPAIVFGRGTLWQRVGEKIEIVHREWTQAQTQFFLGLFHSLLGVSVDGVQTALVSGKGVKEFKTFYSCVFHLSQVQERTEVFCLHVLDREGNIRGRYRALSIEDASRLYDSLLVALDGLDLSIVVFQLHRAPVLFCCGVRSEPERDTRLVLRTESYARGQRS